MTEKEAKMIALEEKFSTEIEPVINWSEALAVVDRSTYEAAAHSCQEIKGLLKKMEEQRKEETQPIDEQKAAIMSAYRAVQLPLEEALNGLFEKMEAWRSKNSAPVTEGMSTREIWRFEIVDADKVPLPFRKPDEKKIGEFVRANSGAVPINGVRIWKETIPVIKGA